jgi:PPK2 family polyphosphate:nucleotide phosphotransferase
MLDHVLKVTPGRAPRLSERDPAGTPGVSSEEEAEDRTREHVELIAREQDKLLAREEYSLLLVFQGMDGAGKDGTIKRVLSLTDPQGCEATGFKRPSGEERKHDYLWRFVRKLPERGKIGVFNRSWYEEVVGNRVEPELVEEQGLPARLRTDPDLWNKRFAQIRNFEQYLTDNGWLVMKFFLHLSLDKQRERLLERLDVPEKQWKFSEHDMEARARWQDHMSAYEEALEHTSTEQAPWYVVPADHRWYSAYAVSQLVAGKLRSMDLRYPEPPEEEREVRERARKELS